MDLERIEAIIRLAAEAGLAELAIETENWRISLKTAGPPALAPGALEGSGAVIEKPAPAPATVRARMVGIFRDTSPPAQVGDRVAAGQTLGHIESMRILNPITAEVAGVVEEVLVEDGDPVEYGQELLVLTTLPEEVSPPES
ncbi:MAG: biotin/lipoyl-binding protein [Armatimonadetes bacterium]|nr:biotin/lipoyl-binding protein [Armatimonadota bacterium]